MPYFNFHLNADVEIEKHPLHVASKEVSESLLDDDDYIYDELHSIKIRSQLKSLKLILCNLIKYPNQVILYSRQHTETLPQRYNPQQIGIKRIITVVDKLADAGYIKNKTGDNAYYKQKEDNSHALMLKMAARLLQI